MTANADALEAPKGVKNYGRSRPPAIAISPDGTRAYAANYEDNTVSVIDTATKGRRPR